MQPGFCANALPIAAGAAAITGMRVMMKRLLLKAKSVGLFAPRACSPKVHDDHPRDGKRSADEQ